VRRGTQLDEEEEAHCMLEASDSATYGLRGTIRYPIYMGMRVVLIEHDLTH